MISLFAGTASYDLASQVANLLKISLSKSEVIRFDDSEVRVRVIDEVKNKACLVIQYGLPQMVVQGLLQDLQS